MDAVRIYLDQALVKEPYGSPTQYHVDLPWWPFDSPHACTIWIALDDSTRENGCLYFVPGSHRLELTTAGDLGPDLGALFAPSAAAIRRCRVPFTPADVLHNARTSTRRREHDAGPGGDDSALMPTVPLNGSRTVASRRGVLKR